MDRTHVGLNAVIRRVENYERVYQPPILNPAVCGDSDWVQELGDDPSGLPNHAHLYACGLRWERERDAPAGWELVQALRSGNSRTRAVAAALLAKTEDGRIPIRAVRRAGRQQVISIPEAGNHASAAAMKTPSGLAAIEDCMSCAVRKQQWFCNLSAEGLKSLDAVSHPSTYPDGAPLFVEGQQARGVYVLCAGRAKLSTTSREGKVLILRIAGPGEVLGLSAAISAQPYELTAETSGRCRINFVDRHALVAALEKSSEFGLRASLALSREFQATYRDIHDLVLARSSAGKLARLLLSWSQSREKSTNGVEIPVPTSLTHEEMAQMIGSSRETVTRLLGDLKKRELIRLEGSMLVIRNRGALEALAA